MDEIYKMNFLNKIFDSGNTKKHKLSNLEPELVQHIKAKLTEAETIIIKYHGRLPENSYDTPALDEVFEKWHNSLDAGKEKPEFVVEALGAAFGQDIADILDCEWQI